MNLSYNAMAMRFEAEFNGTREQFAGDLAALKAAGFKTDGAPQWIWYTNKIPVIQKLRENRPASGLTITPEGRAMFTVMEEQFNKNAAIKAEAAKLHKAEKKEKKAKEQEEKAAYILQVPEGKIWVEKEDLPPQEKPWVSTFVRPEPPSLRCITCNDPVYVEYELAAPAICLWCEKTLFDPHRPTTSLGESPK